MKIKTEVEIEARWCGVCGTEFEPKRLKQKYCSKRCRGLAYKDRRRHDGKCGLLVNKNGLVCVKCGKRGNSFEIVAHHIEFDALKHESQELLCRSCHASLHHSGDKHHMYKYITKEQIEDAISKFNKLEEMCEYLGISRSVLYKKRKQFGFPLRTNMRGFNNPDSVNPNISRH